MRNSFENYATKTQNAKINKQFLRTALTHKIIQAYDNENPKNLLTL
jgi:hypothetical protein